MSNLQSIPEILSSKDGNAARKKFNWYVRNYFNADQIIRDPGTFAMMFTNCGDSTATVNGLVLYPGTPGSILGDSRSISSPQGDLQFVGIVYVSFTGGIGTAHNLEVVTLYYAD